MKLVSVLKGKHNIHFLYSFISTALLHPTENCTFNDILNYLIEFSYHNNANKRRKACTKVPNIIFSRTCKYH